MNNNVRTILLWAFVVFAGWSGYRFYEVGAFRGVKPAVGRVYGGIPLVGKPIREWAYGRKGYSRGYSKGTASRKYRKAVRKRGRRRR